jgi:hypothetical protein
MEGCKGGSGPSDYRRACDLISRLRFSLMTELSSHVRSDLYSRVPSLPSFPADPLAMPNELV